MDAKVDVVLRMGAKGGGWGCKGDVEVSLSVSYRHPYPMPRPCRRVPPRCRPARLA